ncbi:hypothetical protein [Legionella fallonii]|uniref:Uncharacterized protein n=1 Tax=Legionella fallonii LLAP-10 TaxID=1212491 RepID=A0A098G157_9GAMM|nr:hypothetical protein [Legionella fallonii]CEG55721.1 protein of unknown function [Legionella fallonii LLAP-10]
MKTKSEKKVGLFYHATAKANLNSILLKGLRIEQRGKNPYGLDTGVDYAEVYNGSAIIEKPPCIHLTSSYGTAKSYKEMIEDGTKSKAVIIKVRLNLTTHKLIPDPESDENSFYCIKDIPAVWISVKENNILRKRSAPSKNAPSSTAHMLVHLNPLLPPVSSLPELPTLPTRSSSPTGSSSAEPLSESELTSPLDYLSPQDLSFLQDQLSLTDFLSQFEQSPDQERSSTLCL